jgi:hypothetical protein
MFVIVPSNVDNITNRLAVEAAGNWNAFRFCVRFHFPLYPEGRVSVWTLGATIISVGLT